MENQYHETSLDSTPKSSFPSNVSGAPMPPLLAAALEFAASGWPVLPCDPDAKRPDGQLAPNGVHGSTCDPARIRAWWRAKPSNAIGIATGSAAGIFVVDIDPTADHPVDSIIGNIENLLGEKLPPTLVVETPRGGRHLYFRTPADSIGCSRGALPAHVDVRGDGGYVLAPPSRRAGPKSDTEGVAGRAYRRSNSFPPAAAPAALVDAILKRGRFATDGQPIASPTAKAEPIRAAASASTAAGARERAFAEAALKENARELADCGEGGRNNTLNGIAFRMGRLVGAGWIGQADVEGALISACRANGLVKDDGLPSVRKTMASALRAGVASPHEALDPDGEEGDPFNGERLFGGSGEQVDPETGEILPAPAVGNKSTDLSEPLPLRPEAPPPAPFPLDALGWLAPAAQAIARKVQCPSAIAGQSVLGAASLAVQAHADVQLPHGQKAPASIFLMTVAQSGDRKSAADREALWPVIRREDTLRSEYQEKFATWKTAMAAWTAAKKKEEGRTGRSLEERKLDLACLGPEPERPLSSTLTTGDITVDGLLKNWPLMQGALGVFSAEGGQFTSGHAMSDDAKVKSSALLCEIWDGRLKSRVRAGDGIVELQGRRMALHILVQPDIAAKFLGDPELRSQGILSRMLVAAPETLAGTRAYRDPLPADEVEIRRYGARILSILETPPPLIGTVPNELNPRAVPLSADAKRLWIAFADETERRQGRGGDLEELRDMGGKAAEHVARIAVVLSAVEDLRVQEVGPGPMVNAITLMRFYLGEALRLAGLQRTDARLERAQAALAWMQAQGGSTIDFREIMRRGPTSVRTKAALEDALHVLTEHGWVREIPKKRPRQFEVRKKA